MNKFICFAILGASALCASGQNTSLNFVASGGAMGLYRGGVNSVGAVAVQSLGVTPSFNLEASEYTFPTLNTTSYHVGLRYALSTSMFNNTLLPKNSFLLTVHAAPGVVTAANKSTRLSGFGGAELDYSATPSGTFNFGPRIDALYLGNSKVGFAYSMNIQYIWGASGSTPIAAARRRAGLHKVSN